MTRIALALVIVLLTMSGGCETGVALPTPADPIETACWFLTDLDIGKNIGQVEASHAVGIPYGDMLELNRTGCDFNVDCVACWDAITDSVYGP